MRFQRKVAGCRLIVGTERQEGRLIFRCRCLDCEFQQKSNEIWAARDVAKGHAELFPDHRVLVGQAYMLKLVRTRKEVKNGDRQTL